MLGECVLATTVAVESALTGRRRPGCPVLAVAGLVLVFGLWWLYFLEPTVKG